MRSHHSSRRHSWPPFRSRTATFGADREIDENPYAFFISDEGEIDAFGSLPMTAGISKRTRPRSLSPPKLRQKRALGARVSPRSPMAKLRRWIERMEQRYLRHHKCAMPEEQSISPVEAAPPALSPAPLPDPQPPTSPDTRGRREARLKADDRRRQMSRSHSGRPRVWREPSDYIWPVEEEGEEVGLGIATE
ncbi:hypothetical protein MMC20_005413 [Loxospora ochrophaea]|nr:hypothetical protein [Loxospora ochrophaea]